ncbi:HAMP domain-containing protein [Paenibacillus cellulosilyticus]|uniref:histidine kinase n=1 Tax=Paenibacillus cellulosilyticus TaxID=375489 RepID=A0A2V2YTB3_9BACL|nr:sensor histidine kinase [Paenibacillus cellulosilyticus]PWW02789.1 HAMP domain-containing protein [Paenibacillus cellulosilyticus]QKS45712.1 HAMP domain-containing protein [Paenibacillus cellulosilyticus]
MKRSLLRKLFLNISLVLILAFIVCTLIGKYVLQSYFLQSKLNELQPQMESIAETIGAAGQASTYLLKKGFIIKAYDLNAREMEVFGSSTPSENDLPAGLPRIEDDIRTAIEPYVSEIIGGGQVATITKLDGMDDQSILIGQPIRQGETLIGGLFLIKPISELTSAMRGFMVTFMLAALLALALTLYILYRVIKPMIQPIKLMTSSSEAMAKGNYDVRVPANGYGELGELASSFNILASRLEQNHNAAVKLEQVRRDYVANVTHELRTPLASIRAMSETLGDRMVHDEEEKQRYYYSIQLESHRLHRLIDDMLELSRLQSGSTAFKKSLTSARPIIEKINSRFSILAEDLDIKLSLTDQAWRIPDFFGHGDRVEQVLTILLDNALKYTESEGTVKLDASWDDEIITVSVSDTGQGISEEELPFVFDRFYKSDKSHAGQGTGLGLSLAKEILTLLNETIGVHSSEQGTCFYFTLHRN